MARAMWRVVVVWFAVGVGIPTLALAAGDGPPGHPGPVADGAMFAWAGQW